MSKSSFRALFRVIVISIGAALFVLPLIHITARAFGVGVTAYSTPSAIDFESLKSTLQFTISEAFISSILSTLLSVPVAWALSKRRGLMSQIAKSIALLPFVLPGVLVVLASVVFYGKNGVLSAAIRMVPGKGAYEGLTFLYGYWGIIVAHVFFNISVGVRFIGSSWERINPHLFDAAQTLGAKGMTSFRTITLPLLRPAIGYSFTLVFIYCAMSFLPVLVFGGGILKTLEVAIYNLFSIQLDFIGASRIVLLQSLMLMLVVIFNNILFRRTFDVSQAFVRRRPNSASTRSFRAKVLSVFILLLLTVFILAPLVSLIYRSSIPVHEGGNWFPGYRELMSSDPLGSLDIGFTPLILQSLLIAVCVAILATSAAFLMVRLLRGISSFYDDLVALLPLTISPISYALGLSGIFNNVLPIYVLLVIYQTLMTFPVVYPIIKLAYQEFDKHLSDAASLLGASTGDRFLSIELPMLKGAFVTSLAYGLAISLGDFSGVMLLGQGRITTITIAIYRLMGHYHFQQATALGSLLAFATLILFIFIERSAGHREVYDEYAQH